MITIGTGRRREPAGFVEHLMACHARIRKLSKLARTLADASDATPEEIKAAAHRVRRYFGEALPLHAQDEEETVLPRILGGDASVDAALHTMSAEHVAHQPWLARLVEACRRIEGAAGQLVAQRDELDTAVSWLAPAFEIHLAQEEQIVFPAIADLIAREPAVEAEMLAELRARRALPE